MNFLISKVKLLIKSVRKHLKQTDIDMSIFMSHVDVGHFGLKWAFGPFEIPKFALKCALVVMLAPMNFCNSNFRVKFVQLRISEWPKIY